MSSAVRSGDQLLTRRARFIAENIGRVERGVRPENIVWESQTLEA